MKYFSLLLFLSILVFHIQCAQSETSSSVEKLFEANPQAVEKTEVVTLAIGSKAPDFTLPNHEGELVGLDDFTDKKVIAIVFSCNHCPTAQAYEDRLIQIASDYKDSSFQLLAITPNSPLGLLYNELGYSDLNDDFEAMKPRVEYKGYNFPYLYDGDDHEVSLRYGPVATPHAFVFDENRELIYVGRIDRNEKPGTGKAEDLRSAIDAGLSGTNPELAETKTFGCSTKWAWKTEYVEEDSMEWASQPVTLLDIDDDGIQKLKSNDSEGLRLINVWASWCGPCVKEYPDFLVLQRMYGDRAFEFVSISADKPSKRDKTLKFLKKEQSAVANYIYTGTDKYTLIEAIDADWNGALPYTMLIDDKGNKIWSQQGSVDVLELKRKIVDHELMGRYY